MSEDGARFADEVRRIAERRLDELGVAHAPLSAEELASRFGRRAVSDPAYHYAVQIGGGPAALTITPLDEQQVGDYGPVLDVTHEVERLQDAGGNVPYHQVIAGARGSVMLDLVAPKGSPGDATSAAAGDALVRELLDHAAVRPLLR